MIKIIEFEALEKVISIPSYIWQKIENDFILIDQNFSKKEITQGKIKNYLGTKASDIYKEQPEFLKLLHRCFNKQVNLFRKMKYKNTSMEEEKYLSIHYNYVPPDLVLIYTEDFIKYKETEQGILESKELLQIVVDNLPQYIFWKDKDSVFLGCNKKEAIIAGVDVPEKIIGKTDYDLAWKKEEADFFRECDRRVMDTDTPEYHIIEPQRGVNGKQAWLDTNKIPLHDSEGNVIGILGTYEDISERILEEQKLKESKKKIKQKFELSIEKYRFLFENSPHPTLLLNLNGLILNCNSATQLITGYNKEYFIGKNFFDLPIRFFSIFPQLREKKIELFFKEKKTEPIEFQFYKKDGTNIWMQLHSSLVKLGNENIFQLIIQDITERKQIEKKLKESEEKFRKIISSANDAIITINNSGKVSYWNKAAERMFGYSNEEILGKDLISSIIPERYNEVFKNSFYRFKETGQGFAIDNTLELEAKKKNNTKLLIEMSLFAIKLKNKWNAVAIIRDITESKKIEQVIRENEKFLINIFNSIQDGICIIDKNYNIIRLNPTMEKWYKNTQTIINKKCYQIFHNKSKPCENCIKLKQTNSFESTQEVIFRKDISGNIIAILECYTFPIFNEETSKINGVIKYIHDITEHHGMEKKLKESEKKYRFLYENSPDTIVLTNKEGIILDCNLATENIFRVKKNKIIGKNYTDLGIFSSNQIMTIKKRYNALIKGEKMNSIELELIKKDKSLVWINFNSSIIKINDEILIESIGQDITEKKKAEELIKQEIEKLRELDEIRKNFIIRTSHELRTPLVSICGASELLLTHYKDDFNNNIKPIIEIINRGGKRLKNLVHHLFDVSRIDFKRLDLKKRKKNIVKIIKECINDANYLATERELVINFENDGDFHVLIDNIRIQQVIMNLLTNALQNTPLKGIISIELEKGNGFVDIKIKDTGVGFTEKEKMKIFKMFGKIERFGQGLDINTEGLGLGLYISKEIVFLHGGKIWVESEGRNKGSAFIIRLPIE